MAKQLPVSLMQQFPVCAWVMAAGFGVLVWLALPWMVVVMDDDFWYLKSVVETYQRGRPWTSEWLTPWGASTSLLVVGLYKITGSFTFAVHGALALCGSIMFLGMQRFLTACGVKSAKSMLIALLVLGTPTVFFMLLMFTSVALYLACLWWCLYFAVKKQWLGFFLVWCVAISSRQSAIVWMAIPGWQVLNVVWDVWQKKSIPSDWWKSVAVILAGGLVVVSLKLGMNETHGQKVIMAGVKSTFSLQKFILPLTMSLFTVLLAYGLGSFFQGRRSGNVAIGGKAIQWGLFILLAAGLVGLGMWLHPQIVTTHAAYTGTISQVGFILWTVLAAAGLAFFATAPQVGMLLGAVGSILLVSLYSGTFDYYYIDAFFLCFAAAFKSRAARYHEPLPEPVFTGKAKWAFASVLALIFLFQGVWNTRSYVKMKYAQDRYASLINLAELNVRNGRMSVNETGFAGFGYNGWKLEDYYRAHEGKDTNDIAGFLTYTRPYYWDGEKGSGVVAQYPKKFKKYKNWLPSHNPKSLENSNDAEVIDKFEGKILWLYNASYTLKKVHNDEAKLNVSSYKDNLFPLNDEEWDKFMKAGTYIRAR